MLSMHSSFQYAREPTVESLSLSFVCITLGKRSSQASDREARKEEEDVASRPENEVTGTGCEEAAFDARSRASQYVRSPRSRDPAALLLLLTFAPIRCPYR